MTNPITTLSRERLEEVVSHIHVAGGMRLPEIEEMARALLAVMDAPDGWINVSERMPQIGEEVLIRIPVCGYFNIENGKYKGAGQFIGAWCNSRGEGCAYKVTHWMPLPSAPGDK